MSYVFRIHNSDDPHSAPVSAANVQDWTRTGVIAGNLIDNIQENEVNNPSKIGTSIPSPFARMFLFNTAFKMVNARSFSDHHLGGDAYYQIVSECLDLLELLFTQPGSLTMKEWNKAVQLNALSNSPKKEHKNLARALEDTMSPTVSDALASIDRIYMFYYNNTLIGGTSPFTLVFTAPNWKDVAANYRLAGTHGSLFDGNSTPLHLRDPEFVKFLQKFRLTYSLTAPGYMEAFFRYLSDDMQYLGINIQNEINNWGVEHAGNFVAAISHEYDFIADKALGNIASGNYLLMKKRILTEEMVSDYIIRPSVNYYSQHRLSDGSIVNMQAPMVLNALGITGAKYVGGTPWDQHRHQLNDAYIRTTDITKREIPGNMGIPYPFLTVQDLLEDKLIVVDYKINKDKFVTCVPDNGDSSVLLPIKKEYFDYFTIEDLEKNLTIAKNADGTYEVNLRIPIVCVAPNYMDLSKKYSKNDIVYCNRNNKIFDFALFPFYKVIDRVGLNQYKMILGYKGIKDIDCKFYSIGNLMNSLPEESCIRSKEQGMNPTTKHLTLNNSFDIIEIKAEGCNGLVLPKMKKVTLGGNNVDFAFCVDFGTSNTHIAYTTSNDVDAKPVSFEIGTDDMQAVLFNASGPDDSNGRGEKYESSSLMGEFASFNVFYKREFFPAIIGNDARASYPTKTVSVENNDFGNNAGVLFGNISQGYHMMYETALNGDNLPKYHSDLKWAYETRGDAEKAKSLERVQMYCLQLLWMIKNKVLMNGGRLPFKLVLTFPGRMTVNVKNAYTLAWKNAIIKCGMTPGDNVNPNDVNVIAENEAIAPYYSFCGDIIAGTDLLNVDIGGGTTDLLWIGSKTGNSDNYSISSMFAANDLWGNGINKENSKNDNGFMQYVCACIDNQPDLSNSELYKNLGILQKTAQTSADIMGFLFKHDSSLKTSEFIKNNKWL